MAKRHLAFRGGVHGSCEPGAKFAELRRAEHHRPDGRAAAVEDEVVGAEHRQLELRALDRKQILDGLGQRPVPILGRDLELVQIVRVLDEREPAVQVDLQRLGCDVTRGFYESPPRSIGGRAER